MRRLLDGLYSLCERLAMAALGVIALMVFAQVMGRVVDATLAFLGQPPYGFLIPSLAEFAGFLLVASSFLALAGSLRAGAQIRVTLAISAVPPPARRVIEIAVLAVATALAAYFAWYCTELAADSYRFNERSYGIVAVPLWVPQAVMTAGIAVFTIALFDDLVFALRGGTPSYHDASVLNTNSGPE